MQPVKQTNNSSGLLQWLNLREIVSLKTWKDQDEQATGGLFLPNVGSLICACFRTVFFAVSARAITIWLCSFPVFQAGEAIASTFESLLNVPVIDRTGLTGKFNYSTSSELSGPEAAFDLAHHLALELTEAEEPLEMLIVRKLP